MLGFGGIFSPLFWKRRGRQRNPAARSWKRCVWLMCPFDQPAWCGKGGAHATFMCVLFVFSTRRGSVDACYSSWRFDGPHPALAHRLSACPSLFLLYTAGTTAELPNPTNPPKAPLRATGAMAGPPETRPPAPAPATRTTP